MNVNKIFIVLALISSSLSGQEKKVFLFLEIDNPQYVFFINGQKDSNQNADDAKTFFITSTQNYTTYLAKNKSILDKTNLPGLIFKVKKKDIINSCDVKNLCLIDYNWLIENARIKNEETIELNRFENLFLVLKEKEQYIIYDVVREFSSH